MGVRLTFIRLAALYDADGAYSIEVLRRERCAEEKEGGVIVEHERRGRIEERNEVVVALSSLINGTFDSTMPTAIDMDGECRNLHRPARPK
jgi:hypothetical protein